MRTWNSALWRSKSRAVSVAPSSSMQVIHCPAGHRAAMSREGWPRRGCGGDTVRGALGSVARCRSPLSPDRLTEALDGTKAIVPHGRAWPISHPWFGVAPRRYDGIPPAGAVRRESDAGDASDLMADRTFGAGIGVLAAADAVRGRHRSDADRRRIEEESVPGHRRVAAPARRHAASRSVPTTWRRRHRRGELGAGTSAAFIPLTLLPGTRAPMPTGSRVARADRPDGRLEVVPRNERRRLVPSTMGPEVPARLLRVPEPA